MIKNRSEKPNNGKIEIDLNGPEGNAFILMSIASTLAKQLGMHVEEKSAIIADMRSSDYEHLVNVLEEHFGDYLVIYR